MISSLKGSGVQSKIASLGLVLILVLNAVILYLSAFRGFLLLDYGAFLDGAWRILKGQIPYVDFYYTTGPIHLYLHALFFILFGFSKTAILIHLVTVSSIVITLTFLATYKKISLPLVLLVTFLQASGFFWTYPHPWYDHTAYLWGIIATYFLMQVLPFQNEKIAFRSALIAGAMAILAFMSKTNIGGGYGIIFLAVCLSGNFKKPALAGYVLGNLIAFSFALLLSRAPQAYIENALFGYGFGATRQMARLQFLQAWFKNLYWLPALVMFWLLLLRKNLKKEWLVLFWGTALVAIFALNTGSLRQIDHLPLAGIYLGLGFGLLESIKNEFTSKNKFLFWIAFGLMLLTTVIQIKRTLVMSIHHMAGQETPAYVQGDYPLQTSAFKGWKFEREDGEILDQIITFIDQEIPKTDSILILSDMLIAYGLTGRESFKKVPFIWDPGIFPAPGQQVDQVRENILNHSPDWLLIYRGPENSKMNLLISYLHLPNEFLKHYQLIKSWGNYGFFKKTS